jgi:preprotein translocase subunit SecG
MVIVVAIFIVVLMLLVLMILLPSSDDSAPLGSTSVNGSAPSLSDSFTIHLESADSYPTC